MNCSNCGNQLNSGDNFCSQCGAPIFKKPQDVKWKLYRSPDKTFSLEYPQSWHVRHHFPGNTDFVVQKGSSGLIFAFSWPVFQFLEASSPLAVMAKSLLKKIDWILSYQNGIGFIKKIVIPRISRLKNFKIISIDPVKNPYYFSSNISVGQMDFYYSKQKQVMQSRILALTCRWGADFWIAEVAGYSAKKSEYNNYQHILQHILDSFKVSSKWVNQQIKLQESWTKLRYKAKQEINKVIKEAINDRQEVFNQVNKSWGKLIL